MGNSWAKIWNVVSLTCTVIVAIGAIVGIWAFLLKPTAKLCVVVKYSGIEWPPTIVKLADWLDELSEEENIRKAITDSNITPENENLSDVVSKYLKDGLREFYGWGGLITHTGFYAIEITNQGRKVCCGVSVKLPRPWLISVWREDNTRATLEDCSVVSIGDLKPQERVLVMAWSSSSAHELYAKEIRVSHDLGVASMDIRSPVGRVGRWVDKHWLEILLGLSVGSIVLGCIILYFEWTGEHTGEAKSANEAGKGED